ncbi:thioredoxin family protein [Caulobacter sp. S45]|uniref:thioredoxin family protein n=1 Tax=Caulobacter sp. S45 TaxID=1641861 RepID=UPI0020C5ED5F|nr:thioredoxin family protein [Caulobacter sp. S45]
MTAIKIIAAAAAIFNVLAWADARAAVPPKADVASFSELPLPLPYPYDPQGDADAKAVDAKVERARSEALREHKLLLIDMGGNWCADCRILAGTMDLPSLKRFVDTHYVEVTVDSGRHMDQNLQVPARYGVPKLAGVPSLFIVDPRSGRLLDAGHTPALADARHMTPQGLADWLAQWP